VSDAATQEKVVFSPPAVPTSAGALLFDRAGRLLILKTTYKKGWSIPGGMMEADGETPWQACRREVYEECGLVVERGRLACVDFLRPNPHRTGGLRFVFHCGKLSPAALAAIVLQADEIAACRLCEPGEALRLLTVPLRRRVRAALGARHCVYLENGRPVPAVRG
jgi:8-oxo-dGTP diphosphatase